MANSPRFILEGTWTGYVSRQSRVVHREVVSAKRAERLKKLHKIVYTDGTALLIFVREAEPRERVETSLSYRELINEAERSGKTVFTVGVDDKTEAA